MVKAANRIAKETKAKPESDVVVETKGDEVHIMFGSQRRYRIRGLEKNNSS
jgi:hypothetical protein